MTDQQPLDAALSVSRDYSAEVQLAPSRVQRVLLLAVGHLSVALAVLGVFLPLLPTTPFLLVAAACYMRASARFYNWLLNNRVFGPMIIDWRRYRAIRLRHKVIAVALIVLTIGSSVVFFIPFWPAKIMCALTGVGSATFILRQKTR